MYLYGYNFGGVANLGTQTVQGMGLMWAEPDLNRRPLARKANVLTKLDDRPAHFAYSKTDLS